MARDAEKHRAAGRAHYARNKEAIIARAKQWRQDNPEQYERGARDSHLRRKFGISLEEYEAKLAEQGGVCALCGQPPASKNLHVDHDHRTGNLRGLLCVKCNTSLERLETYPGWEQRASGYLQKWADHHASE